MTVSVDGTLDIPAPMKCAVVCCDELCEISAVPGATGKNGGAEQEDRIDQDSDAAMARLWAWLYHQLLVEMSRLPRSTGGFPGTQSSGH